MKLIIFSAITQPESQLSDMAPLMCRRSTQPLSAWEGGKHLENGA